MIRKAVLLSLILILQPALSWACKPAPAPEGETLSPAAAADYILAENPSFLGTVEIKRVEHKAHDSKTRYDLRVIKQYAGATKNTFTVYADPADMCAFARPPEVETLIWLRADQTGEPLTIDGNATDFKGAKPHEIQKYLDQKQKSGDAR